MQVCFFQFEKQKKKPDVKKNFKTVQHRYKQTHLVRKNNNNVFASSNNVSLMTIKEYSSSFWETFSEKKLRNFSRKINDEIFQFFFHWFFSFVIVICRSLIITNNKHQTEAEVAVFFVEKFCYIISYIFVFTMKHMYFLMMFDFNWKKKLTLINVILGRI